MVVNKKIIFTILLVLGLLLGVGAVWVWNEYKDDVKNIVSNNDSNEEEEEDEFDTPYVANITWDSGLSLGDGKAAPWQFYVFQPKVVEYKTENGLNYIVAEYTYDDEEDLTQVRHKVDILVSRNPDWSSNIEGLDEKVLESAVGEEIRVQKSYNVKLNDSGSISSISFEELKKEVPVNSRIAIELPLVYPESASRTSEVCGLREGLCDYAKLWDIFSKELDSFNSAAAVSDDFVLVPYSISFDVYKWSEEGKADQEALTAPN